MNSEYLEYFGEAFELVWASLDLEPVTCGKPTLLNKNFIMRDISVVVGMVGDSRGQIFLSMDEKTGKLVASAMLGGMEINEIDELVVSAVGELGNTCQSLSKHDINVDITPPTVVFGEKLQFYNDMQTYNLPAEINNYGIVDINVAIKAN
jgi:chemotaxis protein CheX